MKVIFLDIDGVLNNWEDIHNAPKDDFSVEQPQDKHLKVLKEIVNQTGADIVLSSGWRCTLHSMQDVMDALEKFGLHLRGVTPQGVSLASLRLSGIKVEPHNKSTWNSNSEITVYDRGAEIQAWLLQHKEYDRFLILDDEVVDIKEYFPNNYIKTDFLKGLLPEHIKPAIDILGSQLN